MPGFAVRGIFWSKSGDWFEVDPNLEAADFVEGRKKVAVPLSLVVGPDGGFITADRRRPKRVSLDVALICCHGGPGEDGTLQATLDFGGMPHAGPSVAGAALGMDKFAFGCLASAAGLPVLPRSLLVRIAKDIDFEGPYIVKPRFGGSSIGIEVVSDLEAARAVVEGSVHLSTGGVVEPYMPELFDLQVAIRSFPRLDVSDRATAEALLRALSVPPRFLGTAIST